jgi:hypothetical protein
MWLLAIAPLQAGPVDRVLFVVGSRIVTQSDVVFEAFFDPYDDSAIPGFEDSAVPAVERLRDIAVVRQLAADTSVFRPDPGDVRARADAFLSHWARADDGLAELGEWGLDEQAFLGFLYSRLVAERFVARSLPPPRRDAEPAEREEWSRRYAAWLSDARARVEVRVPPTFGAEP